QLLTLRDGRGQTVDRPGVEALCLGEGTKPGDRVLHRLHVVDERIIVTQEAGTCLQEVAVEGGLGEREVVKGVLRLRLGWCVGVGSPQQQPREQRDQEEPPYGTCGTRPESHGGAVAARREPVAGATA